MSNKGKESPILTCWPLLFWCRPGWGWFSGLWGHVAGSCPACYTPVSPSSLQQGYTLPFQPLAFNDGGGCCHSGTRSCTSSVEPHGVLLDSWAHYLSLSRLWMTSYPSGVSTAPHNLLRVHSNSLSMSLIKILKSIGPSTDPWGTPPIIDLHPDTEPWTTTLCVQSNNSWW